MTWAGTATMSAMAALTPAKIAAVERALCVALGWRSGSSRAAQAGALRRHELLGLRQRQVHAPREVGEAGVGVERAERGERDEERHAGVARRVGAIQLHEGFVSRADLRRNGGGDEVRVRHVVGALENPQVAIAPARTPRTRKLVPQRLPF